MIFPDYADAAELSATELACVRGERLVFSGLSFRVALGGALVVTGANGSGKSSLLRVLATLLRPLQGVLAWGGTAITQDLSGYRARVHYVGHLDAVKPALTAREMLQFWAALRGAPSRPEAALAAFGLEAWADWPCRWLSAGQRRRLALARLVAAPAPVWLLDEPMSGLDRDSQARLEAIVAAHRERGGQVVLATHVPIAVPAAAALSLDMGSPALGDPLPIPADAMGNRT